MFSPSATDVDATDVLTFSALNLPTWLAVSTENGTVSGIPSNDDVGEFNNIVLSVNDGNGGVVSLATFNITVTNVNDAPTITGTPIISVNEDSSYSFVPVGDDIDVGDTLVYSIDGLPSWASFSTSNGTLLGVPDVVVMLVFIQISSLQ